MDNNSAKNLIIVPVFNHGHIIEERLNRLRDLGMDILLVDDGSTDDTQKILDEESGIMSIHHELTLGIGASISSGYEYARDLGYEIVLSLDPTHDDFNEDVSHILDNINYGYDVVNCSRILENYDHRKISPDAVAITSSLSARISEITGFDVTDPLSGIKGIRTSAMKEMELTDPGHGLFLQLFIQAHYFGLPMIEIPSRSGSGFGMELVQYEDPLGYFLAMLETEMHLYPKKSMN